MRNWLSFRNTNTLKDFRFLQDAVKSDLAGSIEVTEMAASTGPNGPGSLSVRSEGREVISPEEAGKVLRLWAEGKSVNATWKNAFVGFKDDLNKAKQIYQE